MARFIVALGRLVALILVLVTVAALPGLLWPDEVSNQQSLAFSAAHPTR